jgi:hypothetical protein
MTYCRLCGLHVHFPRIRLTGAKCVNGTSIQPSRATRDSPCSAAGQVTVLQANGHLSRGIKRLYLLDSPETPSLNLMALVTDEAWDEETPQAMRVALCT